VNLWGFSGGFLGNFDFLEEKAQEKLALEFLL